MSSSEPATPPAAPREELEKQQFKEDHKHFVGSANFEAAKVKAGGLSELGHTEEGQKWRKALVPKDDEEGAALAAKLNKALENPDVFVKKVLFKDFEALISDAKKFYEKRNIIYVKVLKDETHGDKATQQICTLAGILDATFKRGYFNIFETWIKVGDQKAYGEWTVWATKQKDHFQTMEKMCQNVTDMASCYVQASDNELQQEYDAFFEHVAKMTGGKYVRAPIKNPLRAVEKTAFRHDIDRRWKCDNVYDVLRGAIIYPSMEGIQRGAEMICNGSEDFQTLLLKDRFTEGHQTSSGWADALLNGRFTGFKKHVVEIQLHHAKLVSIREDMGGHYLYSIFRSLVEALEVVFGDKTSQAMIADHSPTKLETDMAAESANRHKAEMNELQAEVVKQQAEVVKQKAQNGKLQADNKLEADMAAEIANKHKAEIDKLQAEILKQKAEIDKLQGDSDMMNELRGRTLFDQAKTVRAGACSWSWSFGSVVLVLVFACSLPFCSLSFSCLSFSPVSLCVQL